MKLKQVIILLLLSVQWTSMSVYGATILQYHHVSSETPAITSISTEDFVRHMNYLQQNNFQVISLPTLIDKLRNHQAIPDKTVAITFDDGYDNVYLNARPVLKKLGWPYTVFINPKFSDGKYGDHMSWPQLREIIAEGATVANHTMEHDYMIRVPDGSTKAQWLHKMMTDVANAEIRLLAETGHSHKLLAYPYGEFDLELQTALKKAGFIAFGQQSGAVSFHTDLTRIPRFPASGIYANLDTLKDKIASLAFPIIALANADPLMQTNPPSITMTVETSDFNPASLQCFSQGSDVATVSWASNNQFTVVAPAPLPEGRSRYNCTAPSISKPGRFYWFSQPWLNLL